MAVAAMLCAMSVARADWRGELAAMPMRADLRALDETNCAPAMLEAFRGGNSVRALIFMPGATDELYFFHRVNVQLPSAGVTLADAVVALTNQTRIKAAWRAPFLILHTDEDPLDTIARIEDATAAERIKAARVSLNSRFDDRDWGAIQPMLVKTLGVEIAPGPDSYKSHHFYRHSFAVSELSGWELLQAVALAGKTGFRIAANQILFEGDSRVMAVPAAPADFLASMMEPPCMKRAGAIPLDGVKGPIDNITYDPATGRLFVAAVENHSIEVVDMQSSNRTPRTSWSVTNAAKNFPMASDAADGRLFVGCANPARIQAYDSAGGRLLFQTPCAGDIDGLFYDAALKRLYVIGDGFIDVLLTPGNAAEATLLARTRTPPGTRTGLFIPESRTLAVAVPAGANGPAQVLLYTVEPRP